MIPELDKLLDHLEGHLPGFKLAHKEAEDELEKARAYERRTAMRLHALEESIRLLNDLRNRTAPEDQQ